MTLQEPQLSKIDGGTKSQGKQMSCILGTTGMAGAGVAMALGAVAAGTFCI